MPKFGQYRPVLREYQEGDITDDVKVATKMSILAKQPRPFWVLILPHPEPRVLACGLNKLEVTKAPEMVGNGSLTFNQWVAAVEAATIKKEQG